jgi:glycine dehydrogenase subunit 1
LAATVYLALLGKQGLSEVARQCLQKAHYAHQQLATVPGWRPAYASTPFYQEFTMDTDYDVVEVNERLLAHQIIGPLPLVRFSAEYKEKALFCVTEARSRGEIDRLVQALRSL